MSKNLVKEALENSIRGMLLSGKVTCDIVTELNTTTYMVGKVRKALMREGKGNLWHNVNYLDNKGFA